MPYHRIVGAGTTVISTKPTVLESIYALSAAFGAITAHDAASGQGTANQVFAWTPGALDVTTGKGVAIPCPNGLSIITAAAGTVVVTYSDIRSRRV